MWMVWGSIDGPDVTDQMTWMFAEGELGGTQGATERYLWLDICSTQIENAKSNLTLAATLF